MSEPSPQKKQFGPDGATRLLQRWKNDGDTAAREELFRIMVPALEKVATSMLREERWRKHKIDPQELVAEAVIRLGMDYPLFTENRGPFVALLIREMDRHLVDQARRDAAAKRPKTKLRIVDPLVMQGLAEQSFVEGTEYGMALDRLRAIDERQADVLKYRVYGMKNGEIGAALGVNISTVKRDFDKARAFFAFELGLPAHWIADEPEPTA